MKIGIGRKYRVLDQELFQNEATVYGKLRPFKAPLLYHDAMRW